MYLIYMDFSNGSDNYRAELSRILYYYVIAEFGLITLERTEHMAATDDQPHFLETLYKDLALALGDAVWAFARIEWLTYESLGRLSRDRVDELVGDVNFRPRVAILRRIVQRSKSALEKKDRALAAIKTIEGLAERRNIIVHNPWRIWIDLDAEKFMTEIQKYTNPDKTVDLDQLKVFVEDCAKAEVDLREALSAL